MCNLNLNLAFNLAHKLILICYDQYKLTQLVSNGALQIGTLMPLFGQQDSANLLMFFQLVAYFTHLHHIDYLMLFNNLHQPINYYCPHLIKSKIQNFRRNDKFKNYEI